MEQKMSFYKKKVTHQEKTTMEMILVAVTMIFWVSMVNTRCVQKASSHI